MRPTPHTALDEWTDVDEAGQLSIGTPGDQLALLLDVDEADQEHTPTTARGPCAACEYDHAPGDCRAVALLPREENAA